MEATANGAAGALYIAADTRKQALKWNKFSPNLMDKDGLGSAYLDSTYFRSSDGQPKKASTDPGFLNFDDPFKHTLLGRCDDTAG